MAPRAPWGAFSFLAVFILFAIPLIILSSARKGSESEVRECLGGCPDALAGAQLVRNATIGSIFDARRAGR